MPSWRALALLVVAVTAVVALLPSLAPDLVPFAATSPVDELVVTQPATSASIPPVQSPAKGSDDDGAIIFSGAPKTRHASEAADDDATKRRSSDARVAKYLIGSRGVPYGNGRCVIPLLITHLRYHGTSLLATTLHGWVKHFLASQGNVDLVIAYDVDKVGVAELLSTLRLKQAPDDLAQSMIKKIAANSDVREEGQTVRGALRKGIVLAEADAALLGSGWFLTPYSATVVVRVHPVRLPLPLYIQQHPDVLNRSSWMRCGCKPYCPAPRATVEYVQGTRWYTLDMFDEPLITQYSYWIKLDVDIWIFRPVPFNVVERMRGSHAIFAHTGYAYNGGGCSDNLHRAILQWCGESGVSIVSNASGWWRQDDNVYYSNFVVSAMGFGVSEEHLRLSRFLSEFPEGFFKHRWTDQSLFHKVFGVFLGPSESDFALDWSWMRWQKGAYRENALFWHSKQSKGKRILSQWTRL